MRGETHDRQQETIRRASAHGQRARRAAPSRAKPPSPPARREAHGARSPGRQPAAEQAPLATSRPRSLARPAAQGDNRTPTGVEHRGASPGAAATRAEGRSRTALSAAFTQTLAIGVGLVVLLSYIGWICMEMGYRVHMGDRTLEAIAGAMFLAAVAAVVGARGRR